MVCVNYDSPKRSTSRLYLKMHTQTVASQRKKTNSLLHVQHCPRVVFLKRCNPTSLAWDPPRKVQRQQQRQHQVARRQPTQLLFSSELIMSFWQCADCGVIAEDASMGTRLSHMLGWSVAKSLISMCGAMFSGFLLSVCDNTADLLTPGIPSSLCLTGAKRIR